MSECVLVLTTLPADFDAVTLARELVGSRLAACVNILPSVQSVYTWQGATEVDREQQLLMKTTRPRAEALWLALRLRHPYEVPEFIVLPILEGNPAYLKWMEDSTLPAPERSS
jgi:periplasmic divalent cation tolerance protein